MDAKVPLTKALELAGKAQKQAKEAETHLKKAHALVKKDKKLLKEYLDFCREVAHIAFESEEYAKSAMFFAHVLQHQKADPEGWIYLGTAYANQNMAEPAMTSWQQAMKYLDTSNPEHAEMVKCVADNTKIVAKAMAAQRKADDDAMSDVLGVLGLLADDTK